MINDNLNNHVFLSKNNSKKISELKPRDVITYHQEHSWIPIAQYDSRIGAYTNIAINISALTSYVNAYAYSFYSNISAINEKLYHLQDWLRLYDIGEIENLGYITPELNEIFTYSTIAQNLTTYAFSYTNELHGWEYLFGHYDVDIPERPAYLYTELEQYIITEEGEKIVIDD